LNEWFEILEDLEDKGSQAFSDFIEDPEDSPTGNKTAKFGTGSKSKKKIVKVD
jgi:hypothetical protein